MILTIRLGQWGYYTLRAELLNFFALCEVQSRSGKTRVGLQLLFYLSGVGQYLSCFIKCVGAKCTKRCCRVQQRWSARRSVSTQRSPLCALSNSALCTLYLMPTVKSLIPPLCGVWKSTKGGLCDKNVFTAFGA